MGWIWLTWTLERHLTSSLTGICFTVRPEISEMKNELGELEDKDKDIADILAKYFNSVNTPVNDEEMPELDDMYRTEIQGIEVTQQGVQAKVEKLNVSKSCGSDDIHHYVLQKTASAVSIPL